MRGTVVRDGWPEDGALFDTGRSVVCYGGGGPKHDLFASAQRVAGVQRLAEQGVGLVLLHQAVRCPIERVPLLLGWAGGAHVVEESARGHWRTHHREFPAHPVTRGVEPLALARRLQTFALESLPSRGLSAINKWLSERVFEAAWRWRPRPARAPPPVDDLIMLALHASARLPDAEIVPAEGLPPSITGGEPRRRPLRLGMINNPLSGQNARHGLLERVRTLLTAHPAVSHFEESTVGGMGDAVEELLRAETEVIVVNGGDGSVQAVLTALLRPPLPAALPLLAVLPGGSSNTTARNVGYGRRPLQALQRLLEDSARGVLAGTVERRSVVRVDAGGSPQFAMLFGAGAVYHGIAFFRREVESRGVHGQLGAGVALATFVGHVLAGNGGRLFPPLHAEILIDGQATTGEPYFGILTSTMDRQVLGISPYWGVGPGRLRFSSLSYAPRRLWRAIVPALRGRPSVHLRPELGYRSVNADEVRLTFDSGYTLDGELFEPSGANTCLTLSGRQHAYFLRERP